jgi:hypothetical protein
MDLGNNEDMVNPEKLAKYVTEDEEKQSKNTTQYVLDTTMSKQTQKNTRFTKLSLISCRDLLML